MFLLWSEAFAADERDSGWYIGAGAGRTHLARGGTTGTAEDVHAERVSAAKVFLGYQFRPPVALEVTYASCGTVGTRTSTFTGPSKTLHIRVLTFQFVGTFLRVENAALQGRVGGLAWRALPGTSASDKEIGFGIAAGMSLKYDIGKNVAVRADFDMYRNLLENAGLHWGANIVSLNIIGSFR